MGSAMFPFDGLIPIEINKFVAPIGFAGRPPNGVIQMKTSKLVVPTGSA